MRTKTKKTYNNYQFYERPALTKYLEEQSIKGYSFCGAVGSFLDILKFRYDENKDSQSYCVLRKRLDKNIDEKIQIMKTNSQIIYENNVYVVISNQTDNEKTRCFARSFCQKVHIIHCNITCDFSD